MGGAVGGAAVADIMEMASNGSTTGQQLSSEKPFNDQSSLPVPLALPGVPEEPPRASLGTNNDDGLREITDSPMEPGDQQFDVVWHPPNKAPSSTCALPPDFRPCDDTVVIGKGRTGIPGNRRLRALAAKSLPSYTETNDRRKKSEVLSQLLHSMKTLCPVGAFVRQVGSNRWVAVSDSDAREKIACVLRDLAHERYRSSTQAKSALRRQKREKDSGKRGQDDRIRAIMASGSFPRFQPDESSRGVQKTRWDVLASLRTEPSASIPQTNLQAQNHFDRIQIATGQQRQQQPSVFSNLLMHQASRTPTLSNSAGSLEPGIGNIDPSTFMYVPPQTNVAQPCSFIPPITPQFFQQEPPRSHAPHQPLHQDSRPDVEEGNPFLPFDPFHPYKIEDVTSHSVEPVPLGTSSFALPSHVSVAEAVCLLGSRWRIAPPSHEVSWVGEPTRNASQAVHPSNVRPPSPFPSPPDPERVGSDPDGRTISLSPRQLSTLFGGDDHVNGEKR